MPCFIGFFCKGEQGQAIKDGTENFFQNTPLCKPQKNDIMQGAQGYQVLSRQVIVKKCDVSCEKKEQKNERKTFCNYRGERNQRRSVC